LQVTFKNKSGGISLGMSPLLFLNSVEIRD
jgi:hypothetical protein